MPCCDQDHGQEKDILGWAKVKDWGRNFNIKNFETWKCSGVVSGHLGTWNNKPCHGERWWRWFTGIHEKVKKYQGKELYRDPEANTRGAQVHPWKKSLS